MELSKREKTIKYICFCLLISAAALLQNVGGLWLEIGNARCFFLIPLAVLFGLGEDEKIAALLGLFAGVLWDTVSVQHMGFNAVFLTLVCYVSAALVNFVFRDTYWVGVVGASAAALLYCLLYWLIIVLPHGSEGSALSLFRFYIPCFIYTAVMTALLNLGIMPLKRILNKIPKEE